MTEILVTGSTGFVGRALVPSLVADGHGVTLLTRDTKAAQHATALHPTTAHLLIDDLDAGAMTGRFDAIVHLAGLTQAAVRAGAMEEPAFQAANVTLTERLTHFAADAGIARFLFLSSILAVTANTATAPITDETPPAPDTAYGRSKLAAEAHVATFAATGRFGISLRPPLVIGTEAGGNWGALQRLARSGVPLPFGAIHNRRSLIDRDTLCAAIVHLAGRDWPTNLSDAYAIAQPEPVSLSHIIAALRQGMGLQQRQFSMPASVLRLAGKLTGRTRTVQSITGDLVVDPSRFLSTFDFAPEISILDAVAASGRQFKTEGE